MDRFETLFGFATFFQFDGQTSSIDTLPRYLHAARPFGLIVQPVIDHGTNLQSFPQ